MAFNKGKPTEIQTEICMCELASYKACLDVQMALNKFVCGLEITKIIKHHNTMDTCTSTPPPPKKNKTSLSPSPSLSLCLRSQKSNRTLTLLKAGGGTCLDDCIESNIGLTTAGRKSPKISSRKQDNQNKYLP